MLDPLKIDRSNMVAILNTDLVHPEIAKEIISQLNEHVANYEAYVYIHDDEQRAMIFIDRLD